MATGDPPASTSKYRPAPLASLPPQLDPAEYQASPEKRRVEEERVALRSRLKRQYLLQLNDPRRTQFIDDPALTRWTYARLHVYPNFRVTPKTSLLGAVVAIGPIAFWWYILKRDRDNREKLIQEGKLERPFHLCS
ncbi:NADH dehydrogenase [ubiquinone] 1 beta subcomplex subunit 4 [Hemicordylus capensis]|uniref:NADH dehydrogenase [ubiquinone] 1 beta subcomplex subunit 4 n=1 Tax=Hemicordylus capensis TaxID=884348 RepID=UPI0023042CB2|nr:NADH dehydrogenase [ubiquinone] 1 beta subcomplex subunit 4 [Hemicordylus capensis]